MYTSAEGVHTMICPSTWAGHHDHVAGAEKYRYWFCVSRWAADEEYGGTTESWVCPHYSWEIEDRGEKLTIWRQAERLRTVPSGQRVP